MRHVWNAAPLAAFYVDVTCILDCAGNRLLRCSDSESWLFVCRVPSVMVPSLFRSSAIDSNKPPPHKAAIELKQTPMIRSLPSLRCRGVRAPGITISFSSFCILPTVSINSASLSNQSSPQSQPGGNHGRPGHWGPRTSKPRLRHGECIPAPNNAESDQGQRRSYAAVPCRNQRLQAGDNMGHSHRMPGRDDQLRANGKHP